MSVSSIVRDLIAAVSILAASTADVTTGAAQRILTPASIKDFITSGSTLPTIAKAQSLDLSAFDTVAVLRYDATTPRARTYYQKRATTPAHVGYFTDAGGNYWEILPDHKNRINAFSLGAKGDGIFSGAWTASTPYFVGNYVRNANGVYLCKTAGTSAASGTGPAGTGATINDGTAAWSFYAASAGTDDTAALRATIGVAQYLGAWTFIPAGSFVCNDYLLQLDARSHIRISGAGRKRTRLLHRASGKPLLSVYGANVPLVSGISPTAPMQKNDTKIYLASLANLVPDMYFTVNDPAQPIYDNQDNSLLANTGQVNRIKNVNTGDSSIDLWHALELDFPDISQVKICRYHQPNFGFRACDFGIYNEVWNGTGIGSKGISLSGCIDVEMHDLFAFKMDDTFVEALRSIDIFGYNIRGEDFNQLAGPAPYFLSAGRSCHMVHFSNCHMRGGRHASTGGGGTGDFPPRHVYFTDCTSTGNYGAGWDCHEGCQYFRWTNCHVVGPSLNVGNSIVGYGFQVRGSYCTLEGCSTSGGAVGLSVSSGGNVVVNNCSFDNHDTGAQISNAFPVTITRSRFRGLKTTGVSVTRTASLAAMPDITLQDLVIRGAVTNAILYSTAPVATWEDSHIIERVRAPDALNFASGVPNYIVNPDQVSSGSDNFQASNIPVWATDASVLAAPQASQAVLLLKIKLARGRSISKLFFGINTASANQTGLIVGLYDRNGNRLVKSADQGTTTPAAGVNAVSLGSTFTVPYDGDYYAAWLQTATTLSTFRGKTANISMTSLLPKLVQFTGSGLTDLPATITVTGGSNTGSLPFVAVA